MTDKGAREVARALRERKALTRGNARTDGSSYFLFGETVATFTPEDKVLAVKARLTDKSPRLRVTWAGWPTVSTARHLNVVLAEFRANYRARLIKKEPFWESPAGTFKAEGWAAV